MFTNILYFETMKKLFFITSLVLIGMSISAQNVDDVTLVVSGDGATKEEATHIALRSAIEQAYGVFVSANTEILNDELVKDEIATVTSGNVKSYKELSATILPNGKHMVSLQAVVSTKNLAAYAESKGSSCEFAGATFGANLKLLELNRKNTELAFDNLLKQCEAFVPYLFETKLEVGNPNVKGQLPVYVTLYSTPNMWELGDLILTTLKGLQIKQDQLESLKEYGAEIYGIDVVTTSFKLNDKMGGLMRTNDPYLPENNIYLWHWDNKYSQTTYFYSPFPYKKLEHIFQKVMKGYYIADDQENNYDIDITPLIIGKGGWNWGYHEGYEYVYQDVNISAYYFVSGRISFPYSYLKPYRNKKTQEMVYPKKNVGKAKFELDIPIEILSQISNFEILKHED